MLDTLEPTVAQGIRERFPTDVQNEVAALFAAATKRKSKAEYEKQAVEDPDDSLAQLIACC